MHCSINPGRSMIRTWKRYLLWVLSVFLLAGGTGICFGHMDFTPLEFLKEQEKRNRDRKGKIYLGKAMTLNYANSSVEPRGEYGPLLLELTDVLKTPLRNNYLLALKGYCDSGENQDSGLRLSTERAENLKKILTRTYGLEERRISAEGFGSSDPVSSNGTEEGRSLNRRVEIHVYGDVSEATRFMEEVVR